MLYTRKGDGGTTGLFGTKERMPKNHPVFDALGSVDELNSFVGFCRAYARENHHSAHGYFVDQLDLVQEALFIVQAELAGAEKHIIQAHVDSLEATIGEIEEAIEKPTSFVVPGATVLSALFDYARTVSRRTERAVVEVRGDDGSTKELRAYLNRLSSFFYALARYAAQIEKVKERIPTYDLKANT